MVPFSTALSHLLESFQAPLHFESIPLSHAVGRVSYLAHHAPQSSPSFTTAAMDGYAIKAQDQSLATLTIQGSTPAGSIPQEAVIKGHALKTFTGSMMPEGADTLIPIENVRVEGETIAITSPVPQGFAVRQIGEDYLQGSPLILPYTPLSFAHIGLLASWGKAMIPVVKKPTVAILATGSELLDLGEVPTNPSQIRSVNNLMLSSLALQSGADVLHMGITPDHPDAIGHALHNALAQSDIVVSTGGVSVGDFDFVKEIITTWDDAYVVVKGVNIKPGQHITIARVGNKYFFGLPGFSASAAVTFTLFVTPIIRRFLGLPDHEPFEAILQKPYSKKHTKAEFLPCSFSMHEGQCYVTPTAQPKTTSANILSLMEPSTVLALIPEEISALKTHDKVLVYPFPKGVL